MEVAPENKCARWQAYSSFFSQMAIISVGLLRLLNTSDDGQLAWRNIYLVPALVGVAVVLLLTFVVRESDVFLKQRIAYLEISLEVRQNAAKKKQNNNNGGMVKAFRYIFKDKQMKWVMVALLLFRMAFPSFANFNESIMTTNGMSTDAVSVALIFSPPGNGLYPSVRRFRQRQAGP